VVRSFTNQPRVEKIDALAVRSFIVVPTRACLQGPHLIFIADYFYIQLVINRVFVF
jgi:hypothetical protein